MLMIIKRSYELALLSGQVWATTQDIIEEYERNYYNKSVRAIPAKVGRFHCYIIQPKSQSVAPGAIPSDHPVILLVDEEFAAEVLVCVDPRNGKPLDIIIGE